MSTLTSQKGAAVVEFAILAILLLVFVFGIIEFGLLWMQSHYIANAAREGARVASKLEHPTDPTSEDFEDVETAIKGYLKGAVVYSDSFVEEKAGITINKRTLGVDTDAVEVTVSIETYLIWEPVLWPLLDLLPGVSTDMDIRAISDSATFPLIRP